MARHPRLRAAGPDATARIHRQGLPASVPTALVIATTALLLLANGCASLVNTPAQDVAWNHWRICQTQATGTEIRNVQLDGRIVFWYYGPGDRQAMLDCLRRAANTGPALPEPIADSLPRGA